MANTTWTQSAGMTSEEDTDNLESYSEQAEASKDAAAVSAAAAAASEAAASASETAASASETAAETAETNAATSAATATTKASEASTSASSASTSETNAATSASNAATSESNASASETAAAASESAAETARDAALAALDSFDDRYLGVKTSDPTVDNDGDALLVGALYFNSNTDKLYVYNGSSWEVTTSGASAGDLVSTNNLSDLTSPASARTNLGLGTAATTASTAYATAAQGAKADTATQPADLGTAATTASTDYATAAQGAKADTATQPSDLGTAAAANTGDFATAAQGAKADTATQPADLGTAATSAATDFVAVTGDTMTGDLNITGTLTSDGLTVDGQIYINHSSPELLLTDTDTGVDHAVTAQSGVGNFKIDVDKNSEGTAPKFIVNVQGNNLFEVNEDGQARFLNTTAETMRIDSSGNVGIGTDSPSETLQVDGKIYINNSAPELLLTDTDTGVDHRISANSSVGNFTISVDENSEGTAPKLFVKIQDNTLFEVNEDGRTRFFNTTTETIRIDSSGNVGIGTSSPATALDVNGTVSATTVDLGNWTVTESSGVLHFATGGVNKMKLDASGNLTVVGNVTAYGTI